MARSYYSEELDETFYDDDYENDLAECPDCGCKWNPGYIHATTEEPSDYRYPECPECDSTDWTIDY